MQLVSPVHAAAALLMSLVALAAPAQAQRGEPSLRDVLERAGRYVVAYGESLARVIAEESYVQHLESRTHATLLDERTLVSEIAFLPLAGGPEWQAFRNVQTVDGRPIPGAEGRLARLFRDPPRSILGQAQLIAEESARYNLGPLQRNFNAPTTALQFVHAAHQDRFRFEKRAERTLGTERVWIVNLRERDRGTLIRTPEGRSVPVRGTLTIVPDDGRVIATSFSAKDFLPADPGPKTSSAQIDVTFRRDDKLGLWVPHQMIERYVGPWRENGMPYDIVGFARYSNYRRFDVDVRIVGSDAKSAW